jgi:hypothetical protein
MTLEEVMKAVDELSPDELHELRAYIEQREREAAAEDALWDKAFADSQDFLTKLADDIEAQYRAGLTEEFDPDTDSDLQ